jgi:hypothetical protein
MRNKTTFKKLPTRMPRIKNVRKNSIIPSLYYTTEKPLSKREGFFLFASEL